MEKGVSYTTIFDIFLTGKVFNTGINRKKCAKCKTRCFGTLFYIYSTFMRKIDILRIVIFLWLLLSSLTCFPVIKFNYVLMQLESSEILLTKL